MDHTFISKSRKHDDTAKSPHKKPSKRKHSGNVKSSFQSLFPPRNESKETTFKTLDKVVTSAPRSRHFSRSKPHKIKDIRKILGVFCEDNSSKRRKTHLGRRSRENSPFGGSSSDSSPQINEHRSHHRPKNRGNEKQDLERRFHRNAINQKGNDQFCRRNEREDFRGSEEDQRQRITKKLSFTGTSSESDKESPSLLNADLLAPGFGSPVLFNHRNRKLDLKKSPEIVTIAEKEEAISPVLSKRSRSRYSDHELLTEYMSLAAEITDVLTVERQTHCDGKSYLEMVQENLWNVFVGGSKSDNKQAEEGKGKGSKEDKFTGLDFITPAVAGGEIADLTKKTFRIAERKNQERRIESTKIQHPLAGIFGKSQKFSDVHDTQSDRHSSLSKESLPENIFSQHKPKSSAPENFQLETFAGTQFYDFRESEGKGPEQVCQSWVSPEVDEPDQFEDLDAVSYLKKIRGPNPAKDAEYRTDCHKPAATKCLSRPKFPNKHRPKTKSPERLFGSSPCPPNLFQEERESYLEPWENTWHKHGKEVIKRPNRVSCTATSTRPMDCEFLGEPFLPTELHFEQGRYSPFIGTSIDLPTTDFRDPYHNYERSDRDFRSRKLYSAADVPFGTHSSEQSPVKDLATETSQDKSFYDKFDTKKDDWIVSPKFYKRRMY